MKQYYILIFLCLKLYSCSEKSDQNQHKNHGLEHSSMVEQAGDPITEKPGNLVISSQSTVRPTLQPAKITLKLKGYIAPDERRTNKIAARFGGRIEKLYVKYPYQYILKGQKMLELYSPELNTFVEEYLYLQKKGNYSLLEKSKEKLLLLGLKEEQIKQFEKEDKKQNTITIYAPQNGYILPNTSSLTAGMNTQGSLKNNNMNMETMSNSSKTTSQNYPINQNWLREGMYVAKDQVLFEINDLKIVWGIIMGNASETTSLKIGDTVLVKSEQDKGRTFSSSIELIEPIYDEGQKFTSLRLYIPNSSYQLQINSLFAAEISAQQKEQTLTLPLPAVLDLGQRKIIWLKVDSTDNGNGIFRAKEIITGRVMGGSVEILQGVNPGDEVVKHAGYMLDSETLIK